MTLLHACNWSQNYFCFFFVHAMWYNFWLYLAFKMVLSLKNNYITAYIKTSLSRLHLYVLHLVWIKLFWRLRTKFFYDFLAWTTFSEDWKRETSLSKYCWEYHISVSDMNQVFMTGHDPIHLLLRIDTNKTQ
jgi:hypothetical protein